jgi:hypothetical protein
MPQQASNKESVYETTMDIPDILLASQQARKTKSHAS